jgi:3'-5' exonuclease
MKKEELFYFDCEWVPVSESLLDLQMDHPLLYNAFLHQINKWNLERFKENEPLKTPEDWWVEKSHFYPEFCKIICVSYGFFKEGIFETRSVYGDDEKKLLTGLPKIFDGVAKVGWTICGAAITRYDMPWLSKRMMTNGIKPPKSLNVYGVKPWDVKVYDIMEVWGQGCKMESFTPLEMICNSLGIEDSKKDLSGEKVAEAYWNGEIERIKNYCEEDVKVTMKCAERLIQLS